MRQEAPQGQASRGTTRHRARAQCQVPKASSLRALGGGLSACLTDSCPSAGPCNAARAAQAGSRDSRRLGRLPKPLRPVYPKPVPSHPPPATPSGLSFLPSFLTSNLNAPGAKSHSHGTLPAPRSGQCSGLQSHHKPGQPAGSLRPSLTLPRPPGNPGPAGTVRKPQGCRARKRPRLRRRVRAEGPGPCQGLHYREEDRRPDWGITTTGVRPP